jgi:hypothetical protein
LQNQRFECFSALLHPLDLGTSGTQLCEFANVGMLAQIWWKQRGQKIFEKQILKSLLLLQFWNFAIATSAEFDGDLNSLNALSKLRVVEKLLLNYWKFRVNNLKTFNNFWPSLEHIVRISGTWCLEVSNIGNPAPSSRASRGQKLLMKHFLKSLLLLHFSQVKYALGASSNGDLNSL